MDRLLIERAMESAKARIYKLSDDEKWGVGEVHQKKIEKQKEVMQVTIRALKKQIPMKPTEINEREGIDFYYLAFMCPSCGEAVIGQPYKPKYCKHCGQRLDWGEEHE